MFRPVWRGLLPVVTLLACAAAPAAALPFASFDVSGVVGGQSQEVMLEVAGVESYEGTSGVVLYGADAGLGLPLGFFIDVHYYRHTNEYGRELVDDSVDAYVDMAGNEWGASLEWHMALIPGSPVAPFLGVGGSYSRVTLDGKVEWEDASAPLETDTDLYRAYALGGLRFSGSLRATLQAGMTFGESDAAQATYALAGETITVSADYEGYYVAAALSLGF